MINEFPLIPDLERLESMLVTESLQAYVKESARATVSGLRQQKIGLIRRSSSCVSH